MALRSASSVIARRARQKRRTIKRSKGQISRYTKANLSFYPQDHSEAGFYTYRFYLWMFGLRLAVLA